MPSIDKNILITYEIIGRFQADATNASVVHTSSGPINAATFSSLILLISLIGSGDIDNELPMSAAMNLSVWFGKSSESLLTIAIANGKAPNAT